MGSYNSVELAQVLVTLVADSTSWECVSVPLERLGKNVGSTRRRLALVKTVDAFHET